MAVSINIDQSRLQRFVSAVGGPGDRLLRRKAERVAELARVYAAPHGSIASGISVEQDGPRRYKVLSSNEHTLLVHNGSRAHRILPRRAGGVLRFNVGGRVVFARAVNHPGYRGDPFLTRALRNA
jgi:hypothetical protein